MIIADKTLEKRRQEDRPVRGAIIGAGATGYGIASRIPLGTRITAGVRRGRGLRDIAGPDPVRSMDAVAHTENVIPRQRDLITHNPPCACVNGPPGRVARAACRQRNEYLTSRPVPAASR